MDNVTRRRPDGRIVYNKESPKPGPNGTGYFTKCKKEAAERDGVEAHTITIDSFAANYLLSKAIAAHKMPADIIDEMVELVPKLIDCALTRTVLEQALAVFRPTAYKTAIFKGSCSKTEVLEQPLVQREITAAI